MARRAVAWFMVFLAMAGIGGGLAYYKYAEIADATAATQAFPEPQEAVEAVRVRRAEWIATAKAVGTVVALRQVEIRNELAGTIAEVGFSSGEVVEAGQILIRFDTRQEEAELRAAEAEARLARLTLERREKLRSSPAVSAQELDKAREDFAAASARVSSLKIGIEKKTIRAPFRARIGLTDLQPGGYLDVGTPIAMLQGVDTDAYVDFSLPQDETSAIRPGALVELAAPQIPGRSAKARIIAEDASVDSANRAVRFRALASGLGEALRPGAFVDVLAMTAPPKPALYVPLTAVRRAPYGEHVFVLVKEDGRLRARQRIVETGPAQGDEIVILEGLAEGELIAAAGSFKLRDGLLVQTGDPGPDQQTLLN
ncbi:MAG TPA: efflux RND transporter periplasmic adaptor subunit [Alphaproteobacteria bacterium]|nr:efflux RND transporter periplasmic adaptor subunit [Alphaproteobacteria bacterium]